MPAQEDDVLESFFAASVRNLMHEFSDKSLELERVSSLASLGEVNMSVVEQTRYSIYSALLAQKYQNWRTVARLLDMLLKPSKISSTQYSIY